MQMSAIVFDNGSFAAEAPATPAPTSKVRREEEFRSALDRYMAGYIDCQKRRAVAMPARAIDGIRTISHPRGNPAMKSSNWNPGITVV
jgi:hypothetical protein